MEEQEIRRYAVVHILDTPYHVDRPFTYYLPDSLADSVTGGCYVLVPFGGGNRHVTGIVTEVLSAEEFQLRQKEQKEFKRKEKQKKKKIRKKDAETEANAEKPAEQTEDSGDIDSGILCKPVNRVLSPEFALSEELLGLCGYLKEMTFCTFGEAARAMVPVGALQKIMETYAVVPGSESAFAARFPSEQTIQYDVYHALLAHGPLTRDRLERAVGSDCAFDAAERLRRNGFLTRTYTLSGGENCRSTVYVRPAVPAESIDALAKGDPAAKNAYRFRRRSPVYRELLSRLAAFTKENGQEEAEETELLGADIPSSAVRDLVKDGLLAVREEPFYRNPYAQAGKQAALDGNILNDEQETARKTLSALYETHEPKAALLYGVTGSGKTRVIKAMMDEVIADHRQVIMLVPEISLTPQSVAIFCGYYGDRVAVVHSGLSAGERLDVWRRAKRGEVDLVIGTRSAVFAPLPNLGMIVIDEEQEHTYKSDTDPKYHARDAARYRCAANRALLLLASATPSFESYYKAKQGIYSLVTLKNRYGGAALPSVVMADLHDDADVTGETPLGSILAKAIDRTAGNSGQSILFINRRGYQKYISCLSCKAPVMCPHCSVPMTLHAAGKRTHPDDPVTGILVCHYCGTRTQPPIACPSCGSQHLKAFGYGTQRAEEELGERFPQARILRMDTDTTKSKFAHDEILGQFRRREADILLGTQMVTKGHDFPDVTLVGVLGADALLYQDDYRASERTFSLITQVIGRAGRGEKPGCAVIQTYNPENEVLRLAAAQDYEAFYESAIELRRAMIFPPFCDLVTLGFSSEEETEAVTAAARAAERTKELLEKDFPTVKMLIFGPFEAAIYRMNEKYRLRMIFKCRLNKETRTMIDRLLCELSEKCSGKVALSVDVNPTNL